MPTKRQLLTDYLEKFNLDPSRVLQEGWDETGYWWLHLDEHGHPVMLAGDVSTEWREWPEKFGYKTFVKLAQQNGIG